MYRGEFARLIWRIASPAWGFDDATFEVPTITLEGDANGAPHPVAEAYAKKFVGRYAHRIAEGGIGHNLPQESPSAFAEAVIDVGRA